MSFPMPTGDSTGNESNPISAPVNPAPAINPTNYYVSQPASPNADLDQAERRIRDLMSAKDKALADASRAQQRAVELQKNLEQQQAEHRTVLEGATQATESLMQTKARLEVEQQVLAAENMKLKVLLQFPDLLSYAEYIPASADEATMRSNIDRFQVARQSDLARQKPVAQAPAPPVFDPAQMRAIYPPNAIIPAASPSAPLTRDYSTSMTDFTARVKALDGLDATTRAQRFSELVKEAETLSKQQFSTQYGIS